MTSGACRRAVRMAALVALLTGAIAAAPTTLAAPSRSELESARARLHELEREFQIVVERYNRVNEHLEEVEGEIRSASAEVERLERRMASKQDDAVAIASELYKGGGAIGLEVVLDSESLTEMDKQLAYLESTEQRNARVFEALAVDRAELEDTLDRLEDARKAAAGDRARLAEMRSDIDERVAAQADEIAQLNAQIEAAERRAERRAAATAESNPPQSRSGPPAPAAPSAPVVSGGGSNPRASAAVQAALSQVGKPYQWGGSGPDSYDCSGLTSWAWAHAGVALPHNSGMQYASTTHVSVSSIQSGDLLFYGSPIHHVAMYVGGGQMVEAPYSGTTVRVTSMRTSDLVGASRPGI